MIRRDQLMRFVPCTDEQQGSKNIYSRHVGTLTARDPACGQLAPQGRRRPGGARAPDRDPRWRRPARVGLAIRLAEVPGMSTPRHYTAILFRAAEPLMLADLSPGDRDRARRNIAKLKLILRGNEAA